MKNKYLYLLSFLLPILIFGIAAAFSGRLPLGTDIYQVFDAKVQYPGFLMELINAIKSGHFFYSWHGGLGFGFWGTFTYYLCSPLNLLVFFFSAKTLPIFFMLVIYLRIGLAGLTMAIYLNNGLQKQAKEIIVFATIFALMGFLSLFFYNIMWIDSIIMLPLILLGIEKLFQDKTGLYIISLTCGIIFNYYIGIMLCIFSVIYFIYKLFSAENYDLKKVIKAFILSSLAVGGLVSIIVVPTIYALLNGKISMFNHVWENYHQLNSNLLGFFSQLLIGSYKVGDQAFGPAVIYSTIFVYLLVLLFFFNPKFKRKEKFIVGGIILFFYLSFGIAALDEAWQLFQRPIWWQSRYAFTFSTFLIMIAFKSLMKIKDLKLKTWTKIVLLSVFILLSAISFIYMLSIYEKEILVSYYFFFGLSLIIFAQYLFLVGQSKTEIIILLLIVLELGVNTYNGLSLTRADAYEPIYKITARNEQQINKLKIMDDTFYRLELVKSTTKNDGLLYNYPGVNFFSSNYNGRIINFLQDKLGFPDYEARIALTDFNPALLSLLNVKYLVGNIDYYPKIAEGLHQNPYPLALGFMIPETNAQLITKDSNLNYETIYSLFTGEEVSLFTPIVVADLKPELNNLVDLNTLELTEGKEGASYALIDEAQSGSIIIKYVAPKNGLILYHNQFKNLKKILINGEVQRDPRNALIYLQANDQLILIYELNEKDHLIASQFAIFDIDNYEQAVQKISSNLLEIIPSKHLIEGTVISTEEKNLLFTSIPYEKGFTIRVDGQKIKPTIIFDTFIGLKLNKGTHTITIDYMPKGFWLGLGISSLTLSYLLFKRKELSKKKKSVDFIKA